MSAPNDLHPNQARLPFWMRHTFGEVAEEYRLAIGLFIILLLVAALLSLCKVPAAAQVWDLLRSVVGGSVGGGIVARGMRRAPSRRPNSRS